MNKITGDSGGANGIAFYDYEPKLDDFSAAVNAGLSSMPKSLPCKFFYDQRGSELFDQICLLEEYYPTRTESGLLRDIAGKIATLIGPNCHLVELGSGASVKVRILLDALDSVAAYSAVEISREHMLDAARALSVDYPDTEISAICADYTQPFEVPVPRTGRNTRKLAFFPGSTIGNFTPVEASGFLGNIRGLLDTDGGLLIGADLKKDRKILEAAYDDKKGVTAAFNLNLLRRINRELGGDFDLDGFRHRAFYNDGEGRVEMHIESMRAQRVEIGGRQFTFAEGERIHTENSYKYSIEEFQDLAANAGFQPEHVWTDADNLFSIHYLSVR